jgi:hypothetical protein
MNNFALYSRASSAIVDEAPGRTSSGWRDADHQRPARQAIAYRAAAWASACCSSTARLNLLRRDTRPGGPV